jgi:hypothetical protein
MAYLASVLKSEAARLSTIAHKVATNTSIAA